jgi:hypothetical protein
MPTNVRQHHPKLPTLQADPGEHYALYTLKLYSLTGGLLASAELVSTNVAMRPPSPLQTGKETWNMPGSFLTYLSSADKLVIEGTEYTEPPSLNETLGGTLFTMSGAVEWLSAEPPFPASTFYGTGDRGGVGLTFALGAPTMTSQAWTGSLQWYLSPAGENVGPYAFGASSPIEMYRTMPSQFEEWYSVSVQPLPV